MNFYFDDDRELVRWKSKWKKKKWLARREMWRQHDSSRLFGAASVVASNLWAGMPAGLRRLADGCGYGRLVGRCVSLIEGDGQLWDADLLKGLELNEDALAPSVKFRVRNSAGGNGLSLGSSPECEVGTAMPYRLEGLAQLNRELDLAMGDGAGTMPASFLVAHGLNKFGLGMNGLKLTAEEAQVKSAFRVGGARDQGQGAGNRLSGQDDGFRWPLHLRSGQAPSSGRIGVRPESAASPVGPLKRPVQRRFRVWVNAVKVAETLWNSAQEKFYLDTSHGVDGVGYVTEWEQNFPDSLDLRNPFEGEKMEFDGDYVVYCALEVSEKRGRHWVRLPYCCRFRVVDVVLVEDGELVIEDVGIGGLESKRGIVESELMAENCSEVRNLGSAEVDMAWKKERISFEPSPLRTRLADREVLIEFKRPYGACLDMSCVQDFEALRHRCFGYLWGFGKGIAWANSGIRPSFALCLFSKAFAMAGAIRAGP